MPCPTAVYKGSVGLVVCEWVEVVCSLVVEGEGAVSEDDDMENDAFF